LNVTKNCDLHCAKDHSLKNPTDVGTAVNFKSIQGNPFGSRVRLVCRPAASRKSNSLVTKSNDRRAATVLWDGRIIWSYLIERWLFLVEVSLI
jgi:hypothetical protein